MFRARTFLLAALALCVLTAPAWATSLPAEYWGGQKGLYDVDKPCTGTIQMNDFGEFTNIDPDYDVSCWIASLASNVHSLGYGMTAHSLFETLYQRSGWGDQRMYWGDVPAKINAYLVEQGSLWRAKGYAMPTRQWIMEQFYACQRIFLSVDYWVYNFGSSTWEKKDAHAITYYGWDTDHTLVLDSDNDMLNPPHGFSDVDYYANTTATYGTDTLWALQYDETVGGTRYLYNYVVNAAVLICPIPEPLTMLGVLLGVSGAGAYVRKRVKAAA